MTEWRGFDEKSTLVNEQKRAIGGEKGPRRGSCNEPHCAACWTAALFQTRDTGTVFLHSCPPLSSIVLGEPGRGTQPNRVAFDARSQFDREESKGRLLLAGLRGDDLRSFPVVESTHAKSFVIGLFRLRHVRGLGHSQSSGHRYTSPPFSLNTTRPQAWGVYATPPPSTNAFYIGCGVCRPRLRKSSTPPSFLRLARPCVRTPPPPATSFHGSDKLSGMALWLSGKTW